jgi:hypothetical protein
MGLSRLAFAAIALAHAGACGGGDARPPAQPDPIEALHRDCSRAACPSGLTCVSYYGIAGPSGPRFSTCEIPCKTTADCPPGRGLSCATIADGPGSVCN